MNTKRAYQAPRLKIHKLRVRSRILDGSINTESRENAIIGGSKQSDDGSVSIWD